MAGTRRKSDVGDIPGGSAVSGRALSHQGVDRYPDQEGTLHSERRIENKAGASKSGSPFSLKVVIEQWICLGLGIICMISGTLGISMSPGQNDLPGHLAWAGLGYAPLLRIMAAACLAFGVVLVRLGWTGRRPQPSGGSRTPIVKEEPDEKRR
jgi:hypothetical protein